MEVLPIPEKSRTKQESKEDSKSESSVENNIALQSKNSATAESSSGVKCKNLAVNQGTKPNGNPTVGCLKDSNQECDKLKENICKENESVLQSVDCNKPNKDQSKIEEKPMQADNKKNPSVGVDKENKIAKPSGQLLLYTL